MSDRHASRFWLKQYKELILIVIASALFLRLFVVSSHRVATEALAPQLLQGDFVFAYRWAYGIRFPFVEQRVMQTDPQRGAVVLVRWPERGDREFLSRVVGVPGDRIEIRGGKLLINEVATREQFGISIGEEFGPVIVESDRYFVLGTSDSASEDSRHWGPVDQNHVLAQVVVVWLSLGPEVRWSRFFNPIHSLDL